MPIEIRPFQHTDIAAVANLSGQLGYPSSNQALADRAAELLASPSDAVFVATDAGDQVVGWVHIARRVLMESGPFAEIVGLVVDEARRGQGIGRELVAHAEQWARDAGLFQVRVRSNIIRQQARRFYERQGYDVIKQQAVFKKTLDT